METTDINQVSIYHNPRCSKSRETLNILHAQGIKPTVIEYLKTAPSYQELEHILNLLKLSPRQLLRKGEEIYKTLNLQDQTLSDSFLIETMCAHPKLIERPIVIHQGQAKIGRPPESVLEILA